MASEDKIPLEIDITSKNDPKGFLDAFKSIEGLKKSIGGISSAVGALGNVVRGFGIAGVVVTAVQQIDKLVKWFGSAKTAAQELNDKVAEINREGNVQASAEEYKKLEDAIARANTRIAEGIALEDMKGKVGRDKEDAVSRLDETRELLALDTADPLRDGKEAEIRAKYAGERAKTAAARKREDNETELRRLQQKREQLAAGASADNLAAGAFDQEASFYRNKASDAELNGRKLKMPEWWEVWKSPEEDPKAVLDAARAAAELRKKATEADDSASGKRAASAEKAAQSGNLLDQIETKSTYRGTLSVEEQAVTEESALVRRFAASKTEAMRRDIIAAREKRDAEAKKIADEIAAKESAASALQAKAASAKNDLSGLRETAQRERVDVDRAQYEFNKLSPRQRRGRDGDALAAEIRKQESEAREANVIYAEAIPSLGKIISESLEQAKRVMAEVKRQRERQKNSRADTGTID